jgi:hypothetical protein
MFYRSKVVRRITVSVFALVVLIGGMVGTIGAQETGTLVGPGVPWLVAEGKPDEYGLVKVLQEPNTSEDYWAVMVMNRSDAPIFHVRVRIEYMIDGSWYVPDLDAKPYVWPAQLDPGRLDSRSAAHWASVTVIGPNRASSTSKSRQQSCTRWSICACTI